MQSSRALVACRVLVAAAALATVPAFAFSGISAKYDGQYRGAARVVPSNAAACAPYTLDQVNIKGGHLSSATPGIRLDGFITAEGYVDASLKPNGGNPVQLNGRLEGNA